jgi:hypothetical protein
MRDFPVSGSAPIVPYASKPEVEASAMRALPQIAGNYHAPLRPT